MSGIFNGIQQLINGIKTIMDGALIGVKFIINLIKSLIDLIRLLATTLGNATTIAMTIPSWLRAFILASIGISVLYVIIGRNTGKSD